MKLVLGMILISSLIYGGIEKRSQVPISIKPPLDAISSYELDLSELTRVNFWKKVFSEYKTTDLIIHDTEYLDIIYEVVDVAPILKEMRNPNFPEELRVKSKIGNTYKNKYAQLLKTIYNKLNNKEQLNFEEKLVSLKFSNIPGGPEKYLNASMEGRLRSQIGQKDELKKAYLRASPFMREIEHIFEKYNIPLELTRLTFIESMFQANAISQAGAVGIWQIMAETGKKHLKITPQYDSRRDPIKATHAAAKILLHHYRGLGSWPITVLSYNIGRYGAIRAVEETGKYDLRDIIAEHEHRTFGFSAKNYFYELLAILKLEKENQEELNKIGANY